MTAQGFAGVETVTAKGPRTTEGRGRGQRTEDRGQGTTGGQLSQATYNITIQYLIV